MINEPTGTDPTMPASRTPDSTSDPTARRPDGADTSHHDTARDDTEQGGVHMSYGRFGAMIATSTVVMFGLMYINTSAWDHVRWSETRFYMALLMGAVMAFIMLAFMLSMYRSTRTNIAIFVLAVAVFGGSLALVRSQVTIQDSSWMRAMIPHHSIAILTSERAEIRDLRVCELAASIIEAQQREIDEMDWLISDIATNGVADTAAAAADRPVPEFTGKAIRTCP